jgi:ribose-phosphate pyrophosphokinase
MSLTLVSPNFSDLLSPNIEVGKFPDGDSHIRILDLEKYQGQEVLIYHRLFPKQNTSLIVLLLILDALKAVGAKMNVMTPYLPYARQDKIKLNGEVASAKGICNLLARAGCQKLYTFDCHFLNAEGEHTFGELTIHNTSMAKALVSHAEQYFNHAPFEIVVPDAGAEYLVKDLGGKAFKKIRKDYSNDQIAYRDVETLTHDFDIQGKNFLVLDDMISTGGTMVMAITKLKEHGANQIVCATTHGLFLFNCLDKLHKLCEHVFATDSIPSPQSTVSIKDFLPKN